MNALTEDNFLAIVERVERALMGDAGALSAFERMEDVVLLIAEKRRQDAEVARLEQGLIDAGRQLAATEDYWQARLAESEAENDQWQSKLAEVWQEVATLRADNTRLANERAN
jgi:hypothetical protein